MPLGVPFLVLLLSPTPIYPPGMKWSNVGRSIDQRLREAFLIQLFDQKPASINTTITPRTFATYFTQSKTTREDHHSHNNEVFLYSLNARRPTSLC